MTADSVTLPPGWAAHRYQSPAGLTGVVYRPTVEDVRPLGVWFPAGVACGLVEIQGAGDIMSAEEALSLGELLVALLAEAAAPAERYMTGPMHAEDAR